MLRMTGFEPAIVGLKGRCLNQFGYILVNEEKYRNNNGFAKVVPIPPNVHKDVSYLILLIRSLWKREFKNYIRSLIIQYIHSRMIENSFGESSKLSTHDRFQSSERLARPTSTVHILPRISITFHHVLGITEMSFW